jgi:hypothetical protein
VTETYYSWCAAMAIERERWRKLLDWLRGHGMSLSRDEFHVERRSASSGMDHDPFFFRSLSKG